MLLQILKPLGDGRVSVGAELAEGNVLQFLAEPMDADAPRQRRVNVHRLAGDALALFGIGDVVQRAHVVQPVGELDKQDAHVVSHGHDQLSEILRLFAGAGLQFDLRELGDAVDQTRDFVAEQLLDVVDGGVGVLDNIVQKRRRHGGRVGAQRRQDRGDRKRMIEIGIAGRARLAAMGLHRINIGAVQ